MEYNFYLPQIDQFCLEPDNNSMSSNSSYYNNLYSLQTPFVPNTFFDQQDKIHRKGGRRPNETSDLTYEEQGKVKQRRERNKLAAARCRKRRVDHKTELNDEVDDLEMKKTDLQHEIEDLEAQKNELLLLFNAHQSQCIMQPEMKLTVANGMLEVSDTEIPTKPEPNLCDFEIPVLRKLSSFSSFALPAVTHSQSGQGLPFNTRSFNSFNFESLMQGGTGLTPQNSFIENGMNNTNRQTIDNIEYNMNSIPDILHHLEMEMQSKSKYNPKSKLKMIKVNTAMIHEKKQIIKASDFSNSKLISPMKIDVQKITDKRKPQTITDSKIKQSERREIPQKPKVAEVTRTSERRSVYAFGSSTPRMSDSFIAMSTSSRRSVGSSPIDIPKPRAVIDRKNIRSSMCASSNSSSRSSVSEKTFTPTTRRSLIPRIPRPTIQPEKNQTNQKNSKINIMSRSINKNISNMTTPSPRKSTILAEKSTSVSQTKVTEMPNQRNRITTEEQAKAILAERRRTIREENQRKSELENLRIEEHRILLKKQNEIANQRILEDRIKREQQKELEILAKKLEAEEADKLSKKIEAERLLEEKNRVEEAEKKLKIELAAIESEKQEAFERLKKEEIERETRRKRVEIIMSRTRSNKSPINTNDENKNIEANR